MIYIIIPVHNRKKFTRQCLLSLRQQTYKDFKVVVVDDGSTDGTGKMLKKEFPEVHVIKGDGNLWWTGAINLGVKYALEKGKDDDFILTLNNDLYVENNYLENILTASKNKPNSLMGSIAIDAENNFKVLDAGVKINWMTAKYRNIAIKLYTSNLIETLNNFQNVDVLSGRGTIIPLKVFNEIGIYNNIKLPHYGADFEFSVRAKRKGYDLFVNSQSIVYSFSKETGINNSINNISVIDLVKSFFTIKSPSNLKYRWNFAKLCAPRFLLMTFFALDLLRVIFGSIRNQIFKLSK